jgi:hypothetical protein
MELKTLADLVAKKIVEDVTKNVKEVDLTKLSIDDVWAHAIPVTEQIEESVITRFNDILKKTHREISIVDLWPEYADSELL